MQPIHRSLTADDFVIIVRPVRDDEEFNFDEGSWTGEVQVSIITNVTLRLHLFQLWRKMHLYENSYKHMLRKI